MRRNHQRHLLLSFGATLLIAAVPLGGASVAAQPVQIHSRAALERYLHGASFPGSPLLLLPNGARKRFLAGLEWNRAGHLAGFNGADLEQYLTDAQIGRVLSLFGLQSYAGEVHGRAAPLDAAQRSASETMLEQKFDTLYFANVESSSRNGLEQGIPGLYDRLLASYQRSGTLSRVGDSDLGLLFRGAMLAAYSSHAPRYLDDLRKDLAALRHRNLATTAQAFLVHGQLVAARQFAQANTLAKQYPAAGISTLPPLQQAPNLPGTGPTVLLMRADGTRMVRKPVDMAAPLRIVVIAGCHFSIDAVQAIRGDQQMGKLFHEHAIWLGDENESLRDVLQWNRAYPDQPMNVAWRDGEWPMLDSWAIPTFYVFRAGKLLDQWSGWVGDEESLQTLRTHLKADGVLPH